MNNYRDIIIRPIITEKSMKLMEEDNKVTFEIAKGANRTQVRQAIEKIFGVNVVKVNMLNTKSKQKRVGKYTGITSPQHRAIVKIAAGQDINLFGE